MNDEFGIIVFDSTQNAMKSETILESKKFKTRILTTPGNISAGCGLSVFFQLEQLKVIPELLKNDGVVFKAIYKADRKGVRTSYTKVQNF